MKAEETHVMHRRREPGFGRKRIQSTADQGHSLCTVWAELIAQHKWRKARTAKQNG